MRYVVNKMLLFHNKNCSICTQEKRAQHSHGFPMLVWASTLVCHQIYIP